VKVVATTLREVHSTNRHSWSAVAWVDGKTYTAPTAELDVMDRVGGGDGFAAGFIYGLLTGETPEEAIKLGWAHGALLTTFPGDTTMATLDQVRAFAKGGSARIQRYVALCVRSFIQARPGETRSGEGVAHGRISWRRNGNAGGAKPARSWRPQWCGRSSQTQTKPEKNLA
jgi:hypothetical protein